MIQFGLATLKAYTNGLGSGCAITMDGAGPTGNAQVATGWCYLGGDVYNVTSENIDVSALSPASGIKFMFGVVTASTSATVALDVTSVNPSRYDGSVLGIFDYDAGAGAEKISGMTTSGLGSGTRTIGKAMNCSVNITYDQSIARGGTLIFGNDMKMYNGAIEGTLEYANFTGLDWAYMYGGAWASGGVGCGTWTLSATDEPFPFAIEVQQITNGVTNTVTLLKCYSPGLTLTMDRENFTQPTMNFQAVANQAGNVIKIDTT